ncbi:MAG: hypothetical protein AAF702_32750 [Chloroflexota bacterium]
MSTLKAPSQVGLLAGSAVIYLALVGILQLFDERELIDGWLTLGQVMLYLSPLVAGFYISNQYSNARALDQGEGKSRFAALGHALYAGLIAGGLVIILALFIENVEAIGNLKIRDMFVNASPRTVMILTAHQGFATGSGLIVGLFVVLGLFGAILEQLPGLLRRGLIAAIGWTLGVGLLSDLTIQIVRQTMGNQWVGAFFKGKALLPLTAIYIFGIAFVVSVVWGLIGSPVKLGYSRMNQGGQRAIGVAGAAVGLAILLILPSLLGTFLSEVLSLVGLFVLMGLGLNIAVGLAGLLDLGYVTNFAVGAYIMAVLTSTGPLGIGPDWLSFWMVVPLCVLAAMFTGFFFALPVLRMRGDYLAIATLGFGEIIRLLALSDWLKPNIGGGTGVPLVPKASVSWFRYIVGPMDGLGIMGFFKRINLIKPEWNYFTESWLIDSPERIYYLILAFCFLTLFVMLRLQNSRVGRQWMAIREDEDAASAMGIDTTLTKVIAFTISAATGGLTGAIFAMKVTAIFPNSFDLLKSINTMSLIIIGGLGSIPGIVVGAAALIGLPELLREFTEYRLLIYGALLVFMMLTRPEGLWPSQARRRELRGEEELPA